MPPVIIQTPFKTKLIFEKITVKHNTSVNINNDNTV